MKGWRREQEELCHTHMTETENGEEKAEKNRIIQKRRKEKTKGGESKNKTERGTRGVRGP